MQSVGVRPFSRASYTRSSTPSQHWAQCQPRTRHVTRTSAPPTEQYAGSQTQVPEKIDAPKVVDKVLSLIENTGRR